MSVKKQIDALNASMTPRAFQRGPATAITISVSPNNNKEIKTKYLKSPPTKIPTSRYDLMVYPCSNPTFPTPPDHKNQNGDFKHYIYNTLKLTI